MKTPLYSTLSSLAMLTATAMFLSTACPALGEASGAPNNPDKICKYKKCKSGGCQSGNCQGSDPQSETFEHNAGQSKQCPDPVSLGLKGYQLDDGGGTRSARTNASPSMGRSEPPQYEYVSPKNLSVYGQGAEVIRNEEGGVRQVKTDTGFVDVIYTRGVDTGNNVMELRHYKPDDIGDKGNGYFYPIKEGRTPLLVVRYIQEEGNSVLVEIIDNSGEFPSIKSERTEYGITEIDPGTMKPAAVIQKKTYFKGAGLSAVPYRRVNKIITAIPKGQPKEERYSYTVEDLGTDSLWHVTERKAGRRAEYKKEDGLVTLYECDAANENGTPLTPTATETRYTYYTDPMKPESFGKMKTLRRNDGYWENKYYDENANAGVEMEKTESPWLNTAAHEPGTAPQGKIRVKEEVWCSTDSGVESLTETVDGIAIAREWTEKSQVNEQMVREVRHQPHSGGDKVTTTVRYRRAKDVPDHLTGRTVSVHHADGSMEMYRYALNGQDLTITQDTGYGEGDSVSHGTRTVSTQDKDSGNLKEEVRYALEGGQAHWLGSRTGVNFDNKGTCLKWVYNNDPDDYTEQRKDCCHVTWERGRDGIATTYTYDAAGRQTSATSRGITYSTEYKGLTTIQRKQAEGSSQRYLVEETMKNLAQQTVEEKRPVVGGKTLTTQFSYDVATRSSTTTTPYGTTKFSLSAADGHVLTERETTGLTRTYTCTPISNNGGGFVNTTEDGNMVESISVDLIGNRISEQNGNGALTQYVYNEAGQIVKNVLPDGEIVLYSYENTTIISGLDLDGDHILNPTKDQIQKIEYSFDSSWPENKGSWKTITSYAWLGNWKPTLLKWQTDDKNWKRTQEQGISGYKFEQKPSLHQTGATHSDIVISPDGLVQETTYTILNGQTNSVKTMWKDSNDQVIQTEHITLDIWGNMVSRMNPRTGITTFIYDEGTGTLLSETTPDQNTTSYQYDDFGRLTTSSLPDGSEQHTVYDAEGRITRQWGSQQYPVSYEYNAYGQKTGMTTYRVPVGERAAWPEGNEGDKTTWAYEATTGNLLHKSYADGKGMSYTYTPGGKLLTQTNVRGNITTHSYDPAGQLVKTQVNDDGMTPTKTYQYDQIGRIINATTEGVASYQYHYNDQNQVMEEQITIPTINGTLERSLVRSYDAYGRATGYQLKQGDAVEQDIAYTYSPAGQLTGVAADDKECTYAYVPNAPQLVAQVTSPVHTVVNTYEANRSMLASKINRWKNKVDTPIISAYTYTMNSLGQRVFVSTEGEAFGANPADWAWGYDSMGQVASANEDRYAYDQIGNRRTSRKGDSPEMVYLTNALNQYEQIGSNAPMYDSDGNQLIGLTPTVALPDRHTLSFAYNAENRPANVSRNGEVLESYNYDHKGRRIQKGDTVSLYDGYNAIAEYKDSTRSLKTTYAWGNDLSGTTQGAGGIGGLLSVTEHDRQLPLVSYPCYDGNGNITDYLTEENAGTLTAHYEYDAFGLVKRRIGERDYSYQFSTKPFDCFSGLNYYNYRNYDAISCRWMNRDLVEENGGINLYGILRNDSVNFIDKLGLIKKPEFDENKCILNVKMVWKIEFDKEIAKGKKELWKKAQSTVQDYFNNLTQRCSPKDKCCKKCKDGVKVNFELSYNMKQFDVIVKFFKKPSVRGGVMGGRVAALNVDNVNPKLHFDKYSQTVIVHEVGHMLGLTHPGNKNGKSAIPNSLLDYTADSNSLMGLGMEMRNDDFDKAFCSHLKLEKPCDKWSSE